MIKLVENQTQLNKFVYFPKSLYKDEKHYVYPLFFILKRELNKLILHDHTYHAILAYKDKKVVGRLLFTYDHSKHRDEKICYFSMFDCIDDIEISKALFEFVYDDMKKNDVKYLEGTFTPYDPDTRRGILIEGFQSDPALFTSFNHPYYQNHFESLGFSKAFDTLLLDGGKLNQDTLKKLKRINDFAERRYKIKVDFINFKQIDKDIDDIYEIIRSADNDIIYQEPPTKEMLYAGLDELRDFINPKFVTIARESETGKPIGFALVLPDFNQVIKKARGHVLAFPLINKKKTITHALGKMQYVIPKYQERGIMPAMYYHIVDQLIKHNIKTIDMGTMMEDNFKSFNHFSKFGGSVKKTFRIYGKEI